MRIRLAIPDRYVSGPVLDAALEATTRAATEQMRAGDAPTFTDLLRSGVRWRPEGYTDGEHFDLPAVIGERGHGDCDDLGPTLAAELRATGADPGAVARAFRSGPDRWHVVVQLSDGRLVDPSRMAGMRASSGGVHGALSRPMASVGQSAIAVAPHGGDWWCRTDVPWGDGHLTSISHSRSLQRALDGSIVGALSCSGSLEWPHYADRSQLASWYTDMLSANGDPRGVQLPWQRYGRSSPILVARF